MRFRAALALALASALLAAASAEAATKPSENRIIRGTEVTVDGQYDWTVALVDRSDPERAFCGGTQVKTNIVLTAAHCVIGTRAQDMQVVAGTHDLTAAAPANVVNVNRISVFPGAEVDDDTVAARRDVALLTLDAADPPGDPISIGNELSIQTAQPPTTNGVRATGWGLTETSNDTVPVMRVATLDALADSDCAAAYDQFLGDLAFSPVDQMCAIKDPTPGAPPNDDVKDTCNGDSGGPLMQPVGGGSPTDPADWLLLGVTSYGLGCALVVDNVAVPGVYSRAAGDQLKPYANQSPDTSPVQPEHLSGVPQITRDGDTILCVGNALNWSGGVDQVDQLVRRFTPPGTLETVSRTGVYTLDEGDFGDRFICEMHGRASGAGGYGLARSGFIKVEDAPPPAVVQVPGPTQTVTVPGPTQTVTVDPRANDKTAPTSSVRRSCTRKRVCTFTVTTSDPAPSAGVTNVNAILTSLRTRGRRTTSTTTALKATAVKNQAGTFRIRTGRLPAGSYTLLVSAVDGAGNVQRTPRRQSFRLR
jgi:trypsin